MNAYNSPPNMAEDEITIRKGYQTLWLSFAAVIALALAAQFGDQKWVMAVGFGVMIFMTNENGGRLYDLCIRLRRTNILLSKTISN